MYKKIAIILISVFLTLTLVACEDKPPNVPEEKDPIKYEYTEDGIIKPEIAEEVISETSTAVITALDEKDMNTLSSFIHPEKGVRFTPYTHVSLENDLLFTKDEIANFLENDKGYLWGYYDGSGFEIELTPPEYYDKFIYTSDFMAAEEIGYNTVLTTGNMLENQFEVYENPIVVEYYFPGFNPEYEGLDWQSLRLVYEEYKGQWFLIGIIHNQWTI